MEETIVGLVKTNFAGMLAVISTLLGVFISQFFNLKSKKIEYRLRVSDKVLDKRIKAHEEILAISKKLRTVTAKDDAKNPNGELETYPIILDSQKSYLEFMRYFHDQVNNSSHLLSITTFRKINFIQDYLVTFQKFFQYTASQDYPTIGNIVKDDFLNFSREIELAVIDFYEKGAYNPRYVGGNKKHHKYSKNHTTKLLDKTCLYTRYSELKGFKNESEF